MPSTTSSPFGPNLQIDSGEGGWLAGAGVTKYLAPPKQEIVLFLLSYHSDSRLSAVESDGLSVWITLRLEWSNPERDQVRM